MAPAGGRRPLLVGLLGAVLVAALLWWTQGGGTQTAGPGTDPASGLPVVAAADLPAEAQDVLARIDAGGPFKYPRDDGGVFENREELLPEQPLGYYREYTVESAPDVRGPMRIVTGGEEEYYWTEDHYRSFSMIAR